MINTAYKFMKYDKPKSIGIVIGIVISIFLIGQQLSILGFLTGLMGGLLENSKTEIGKIWVVDDITKNANELAPLDERLVREIRSIDGVENTFPIIAAVAAVKFLDGKTAPILLIGSDAPAFVAGPREDRIIEGNVFSLNDDAAVSAEFFDEAVFNNAVDVGTRVEINGKSAYIKVQTKNARGFAGSFFYTTLSKARYFASFPQNKVNAIAVSIKPGYSTEEVAGNINRVFFGVRAWDAEILKSTTVRFITASSNIGTSIGSLVIFAMISGFFIIGLTLYSASLDRLKDYGTLKAIGASNGYLRKLILTQAFIFAIVGYVLAFIFLIGFQKGVASGGLTITFTFTRILVLFLITVFISVGGALFAIRKINSVEPASVFRR
jgi:putative ABC transport system permease protein